MEALARSVAALSALAADPGGAVLEAEINTLCRPSTMLSTTPSMKKSTDASPAGIVTEDGSLRVRAGIEPLGELMISTHGRGPLVGTGRDQEWEDQIRGQQELVGALSVSICLT